MDCSQPSTSSSHEEVLMKTGGSEMDLWSTWKICEAMLKETDVMKETQPLSTSSIVKQVALEMYNRVVIMLDEMELVKDEELVLQNENVDEDFEICTSSSDEKEEEEWEEEPSKSGQNLIPLEYKKKVVEMARAHPTWSLQTLQKNGAMLLKKKAYPKIWEVDIARGGSLIEKYETINNKTQQKFQEARDHQEQVTTSTLKQWAMAYAREINCTKFHGSTSWTEKFKAKYGIRQRKITRFVGRADGRRI